MSHLGQSIIRPGVGYSFTDSMTAWVWYAWVPNSPPGAGKHDFDEQRVWEQLSWGTKTDWGNLSTRTRMEQRFMQGGMIPAGVCDNW